MIANENQERPALKKTEKAKSDQGKTTKIHKGKKLTFPRFLKWLFFLFLFLSLTLFLAFYVTMQRVRGLVEDFLTKSFHRQVEIQELYLDVGGHVAIKNVRIANPDWCKNANWIRVKKIEGALKLPQLKNGIIDFSSLTIEEPFFDLEIDERGRVNLPSEEGEKGEASSPPSIESVFKHLQADRLELTRGHFEMQLYEEKIALKAANINLYVRKAPQKKPGYKARLESHAMRLTMEDILDIPATLVAELFYFDAKGVKLMGKPLMLMVGKDTVFEAKRGTLQRYAHPILNVEARSHISLDDIEKCLLLPIDLRGALTIAGAVKGLADDLQFNGSLNSITRLYAKPVTVKHLRSNVSYSSGEISCNSLSASLLRGVLKGKGLLQFLHKPHFSADLSLERISLAQFMKNMSLSPIIPATINGKVSISGKDFTLPAIAAQAELEGPIQQIASLPGSSMTLTAPKKERSTSPKGHRTRKNPTNASIVRQGQRKHQKATLAAATNSKNDESTPQRTKGAAKQSPSLSPQRGSTIASRTRITAPGHYSIHAFFKNNTLHVSRFDMVYQELKANLQGTLEDEQSLNALFRFSSERVGRTLSLIQLMLGRKPVLISPGKAGVKKAARLASSPLAGKVTVKGKVSGLLTEPLVEAFLTMESGRIVHQKVTRLSTKLLVSPLIASISDLSMTGGGSSVQAEGWLSLEELAHSISQVSQIDVTRPKTILPLIPRGRLALKTKALSLSTLGDSLSLPDLQAGWLDCDILFKKDQFLEGSMTVTVANLRVAGEEVFQAQTSLNIDSQKVQLNKLKLLFFDNKKGVSTVEAFGVTDWEGKYSMHLETAGLDSSYFAFFNKLEKKNSGRISAIVDGQGFLTTPLITANVTIFNLILNDQKLGLTSIKGKLEGGNLQFSAVLPSQHVTAKGRLEIPSLTLKECLIDSQGFDYFTLLALLDIFESPDLSGSVTGKTTIMGSLQSVENLNITGDYGFISCNVMGYTLKSREPARLTMKDGLLTFAPLSLSGDKATVWVQGNIDIVNEQFAIKGNGEVDLALLPKLEPEIAYASGEFSFIMALNGEFDHPFLYMHHYLKNAALVPRAIPVELQGITMEATLNNGLLTLDSLKARLGEGHITAKGNIYFPPLDEHFDPLDAILDLNFNAFKCDLDYPEGFNGRFSANLSMIKKLRAPVISGEASILKGEYDADINIRALLLNTIREVLQSRTEETASQGEEITFNPSFNIKISNETPLQLVSDDVTATFNTDLTLYGDLAKMLLRGNIQTLDGEVTLDDRTITITSGLVSFYNPAGIYPTLDITGESQIQNYHLYVYITGQYPDILISFNSDESLTKGEILSLLLTGNVNVDRQTLGATETQKFASDIIMSNVLNNEIISKVKQLFLIDKFQVTPISLSGKELVGMQITAGANLGGWYLTYTRTPETTDYDIIVAERKLSRRLTLEIIIQDRDRSYGGDIRLKFPFP